MRYFDYRYRLHIRFDGTFNSSKYGTSHSLLSQNVADIKKLKSVGICTIKGIQMTTRRALCNVKGLSEAKVEKIKEAANKLIVSKNYLYTFSELSHCQH